MAEDTVLSILKAVSVLKCFTPAEPRLSVAEIAREIGIPKTTARRLVTTLATSGLLEQTDKTGMYTVGPVLYALGILYLNTQTLFAAAEPVFKLLNDLTTEAVSMAILDRSNTVFVMREESKHALRFSQHIGTTAPAYSSAMGRALLSELAEADIDHLYPEEKLRPLTRKTIATKTELKLMLEEIRKTGISIDREGSYEGLEGIASLIRNASGKAVAAMSFAVPTVSSSCRTRPWWKANPPSSGCSPSGQRLCRLGISIPSWKLRIPDKNWSTSTGSMIYVLTP